MAPGFFYVRKLHDKSLRSSFSVGFFSGTIVAGDKKYVEVLFK